MVHMTAARTRRPIRSILLLGALVAAFTLAGVAQPLNTPATPDTPLAMQNQTAGDADAYPYIQPVWFTWDTMQLDVLIIGVEDPVIGASIKDAIESWEKGIDQLGSQWLKENLTIRTFWADEDVVPPVDFNPNIFFVPQGFMAINTVNLNTGAEYCIAAAPMAVGWPSHYHVALHEFGHCLGLGHVFHEGIEYAPRHDPMGGGEAGYRSCPSNLNLEVMELGFQGGRAEVVMEQAHYIQSDC